LQPEKPPDYAAGLIPSVAPPERTEEITSPASTPVQPSSIATTPRRSTAESTEQEEESSEEEKEPETQPNPPPLYAAQPKGILSSTAFSYSLLYCIAFPFIKNMNNGIVQANLSWKFFI